MSDDWFWAAVVLAIPLVGFGLLELFVIWRRKREATAARGTRYRMHRGRR